MSGKIVVESVVEEKLVRNTEQKKRLLLESMQA